MQIVIQKVWDGPGIRHFLQVPRGCWVIALWVSFIGWSLIIKSLPTLRLYASAVRIITYLWSYYQPSAKYITDIISCPLNNQHPNLSLLNLTRGDDHHAMLLSVPHTDVVPKKSFHALSFLTPWVRFTTLEKRLPGNSAVTRSFSGSKWPCSLFLTVDW